MGSMGHDNEGFFVEHYVDDGRGAVLRRFSRALWERIEASTKQELPLERQYHVMINRRFRTVDKALWAEAAAEWTSE